VPLIALFIPRYKSENFYGLLAKANFAFSRFLYTTVLMSEFFFLKTNFLKLSRSIIGFFRITCNLINSVCNLKVLLKIRHSLLQRNILPYHFRLVMLGSLTSLISHAHTEMSFSTLHTYLIVKPYHAYTRCISSFDKTQNNATTRINMPRCINGRILQDPIEVCSAVIIMFCDITYITQWNPAGTKNFLILFRLLSFLRLCNHKLLDFDRHNTFTYRCNIIILCTYCIHIHRCNILYWLYLNVVYFFKKKTARISWNLNIYLLLIPKNGR